MLLLLAPFKDRKTQELKVVWDGFQKDAESGEAGAGPGQPGWAITVENCFRVVQPPGLTLAMGQLKRPSRCGPEGLSRC